MIKTDGVPTIAMTDAPEITDATEFTSTEKELDNLLYRMELLVRYEQEDLACQGMNRLRTLDFARKLENYQNELSKLLWQLA